MKYSLWFCIVVIAIWTLVPGCSKSKDNSGSSPVHGKITVSAVGITGQINNIFSVAAYPYDWYPGAAGAPVARIIKSIGSDDYSVTAVLDSLDALGNTTAVEKIFDPGEYSVVFFVSVPANPPSHYAEVRVTVNGNMTVTAPVWTSWVHQ
jgi:hypothetical protein